MKIALFSIFLLVAISLSDAAPLFIELPTLKLPEISIDRAVDAGRQNIETMMNNTRKSINTIVGSTGNTIDRAGKGVAGLIDNIISVIPVVG